MLGDLHGHLPGVAGSTQNENLEPGLSLNAAAESHPGGHSRIHRGGDEHGIGICGQLDSAAKIDEGLVCERSQGIIGGYK